ncbi:hypothetical protein GD1_71 [Paraglaciecola Antarctic GD virus 1]|nr:hypothetical protein GD1_71 [Paraglaciecola Antarctic GD virus 1]
MQNTQVSTKEITPLNCAEAIYGFCGWLTTRPVVTIMGDEGKQNSDIPYLIAKFVGLNKLPEVTENYPENLGTISNPINYEESTANQTEALFGFCAWLTSREIVTKMGENEECGVIAQVIAIYLSFNGFTDPTENFPDNLTHPREAELVEVDLKLVK